MPSWAMDRDEGYDKTVLYDAELRAAERERMIVGWQAPMGYRRPVDPPCPTHGYGLVDGACGLCVLDLALAAAA